MRIVETNSFGRGITGVKLGWSLAGPPLMMVYCYIFDRAMVDTGQSHMGRAVLDLARENRVERIFLTHHHEDHSGNAALIRTHTGAEVFGHKKTCEKLKIPYRILPYQKYVWGRTTPLNVQQIPKLIETGLGPMKGVHTPGHSRDHLVYYLPREGVVFSGDLYLGDRIRFFRSDEDMGTQIESLKKTLSLDFDTLLCCHNPREKNGPGHLRAKLDFLENLYGRIIRLWKTGMPEKMIFKTLKLKEDYFTKYFCFGNVSMINGVRSAIRHYEKKKCRGCSLTG